jgi:hypothetical protein
MGNQSGLSWWEFLERGEVIQSDRFTDILNDHHAAFKDLCGRRCGLGRFAHWIYLSAVTRRKAAGWW